MSKADLISGEKIPGPGSFDAPEAPQARLPRPVLFAGVVLLCAAAGILQWFVVSTHRIPIGSDQAVVGLMAKHILEGKGHPVFYWGATYAGSLEPHYVAGVFAVLGVSAASYRIAMALLLWALMLGICFLARRVFGAMAGLAALALLAIAPFFFLYKGLTSDGAYDSVALLTLAIVALALWIDARRCLTSSPGAAFFALGILMGLAFWDMPHTAAVSAVVLGWLLVGRRAELRLEGAAAALGGAIVGAAPWWIWNLRHGWASLTASELGVVGLGRAARNLAGLLTASLACLEGGAVATPDPESLRETFPLSGLLAVCAVLVLIAPAVVRAFRGDRRCGLLLAVLGALFVTACFSRRLILSEPRYLFSYYVAATPLLGLGLASLLSGRGRWLGISAAAALLAVHLASDLLSRVSDRNADEEVTGSLAPLLGYLERAGLTRVYANYWTAYRLAFESNERIIATPLPLDEFVRYEPYLAQVNAAPNPAVVLLQPRNACFSDYLREAKLPFEHAQVGEFGVFSRLPARTLDLIRAAHGLPLPDRAYRVGWLAVPDVGSPAAGSARRVEVGIRNASPCLWPVSVHLSYHWEPLDPGLPAVYDGDRGFPPGPLAAHRSESLEVRLVAPAAPGRYRLRFDLVNEGIDWFSHRGGQTADLEVKVAPAR
ncbi:MAG TPA: glycosyltransferase family 39 protein [Thermoanaerobaculia bacterium]|nr:glycosyltransferase family 39 protein [Thermoanaerobaculia bacterium]